MELEFMSSGLPSTTVSSKIAYAPTLQIVSSVFHAEEMMYIDADQNDEESCTVRIRIVKSHVVVHE